METKNICGKRSVVWKNNKIWKGKAIFENLLIKVIETLMKLKVTPENVFLGSEPPSHLDFQSRWPPSREIFQHAFRSGDVDFFWNNPIALIFAHR